MDAINSTNSSQLFKHDISSLITVSSILDKESRENFIKVVPNIRQLKSDDLSEFLKLDVDFHKFEDKIYLIASNLQTLVSLKYNGSSEFMQHLNE